MRAFFLVAALCLAAAQANVISDVGTCVKDLVKNTAESRSAEIKTIVDKLRQAENTEAKALADKLAQLHAQLREQVQGALEGVREKVQKCYSAGLTGAFKCLKDLAMTISGDLKPKIQDAAKQLMDFVQQHAAEFQKVAKAEGSQLQAIGRDMVQTIVQGARKCLPF